jgi:hypothetical protein
MRGQKKKNAKLMKSNDDHGQKVYEMRRKKKYDSQWINKIS